MHEEDPTGKAFKEKQAKKEEEKNKDRFERAQTEGEKRIKAFLSIPFYASHVCLPSIANPVKFILFGQHVKHYPSVKVSTGLSKSSVKLISESGYSRISIEWSKPKY